MLTATDGRGSYSPVRPVAFVGSPLQPLTLPGLPAGAALELFDALGHRVATADASCATQLLLSGRVGSRRVRAA